MKNLKAAYPHLIAIAIFVLLASIYFAPHFKGYGLSQHDMQTAAGMAKETVDFNKIENAESFWTNSAFSGMPTYQTAMNNKSNIPQLIESNIFVRFFDYSIGFIIIAMISFYVLMLCFGASPWISIIGAIAYGFASINILYLGAGHVTKVHAIALMPGIIAGLVYAYRKNLYIGAALVALFVCLHVSANHIQETYYLLFLIFTIIAFEFYRFYKEKLLVSFIKITGIVAIAAIIGLLPAIIGVLLPYEHGKYTTRGKSELTINASKFEDKTNGLDNGYIKQYSLGYGEVWSVAVPNIKGGASGYIGNDEKNLDKVSPEFKNYVASFSSYWGEQLFSGGAFYFGAIIFLLFVLGVVFIKDKLKWAFFSISMLAVVLSWKFGFITDLFINNFPLFNKFRDTKMMLVIAQLSFPFLGMLFLNELFSNKLDKKKLNYALIGTIGVFVIFYIMPTVWFSFFNSQEKNYFDQQMAAYGNNPSALQQLEQFRIEIQNVRVDIFKADVLRSILFMLVAGLFIYLFNAGKLAKKYLLIVLGVLILFDIWSVDKRYLNNKKENGEYRSWVTNESKAKPYPASEADKAILQMELRQNPALSEKIGPAIEKLSTGNDNVFNHDELALFALRAETNYRVFTLQDPFSNASVSYYHKSIGGYHGAKLKRYQDLIDFRLSKEYEAIVNAFNTKSDTAIFKVINSGIPTLSMLNTKYIIYNPGAAPIVNPNALGNVWFVRNVKVVANPDAEILALDSINPAQTAVVDKRFENFINTDIKEDSTAKIALVSYKANALVYESNTNTNQIAIFSEIYYKDGWNAYIDGNPADYFRANYVLRGIQVPAGKHKIEFRFEPTIVRTARNISLAGSVLLFLFIGGMLFFNYKKKKE
ncbi:MAG TPA: YfhO family protein [Bacteroidales bacterium]|nr:YfhO family protein [Bacteroidales bacterium]